MPNTKNKAEDGMAALQKGMSSLQDDLQGFLKMMEKNAGVNDDIVPALTERLQEGIDTSVKWAQKATKETRKQVEDGAEIARTQVQENPLTTLAAAVSLGLLCGRLMAGGKR